MPVFYTDPENIAEDTLVITGEEMHHVHNVMRFGKGDKIMVVDGVGNGYNVQIEKLSPRKISCGIISRVRRYGEPNSHVTLAVALSTGFKLDDIIQRATELGVCRIIPMTAEKSIVRIDDVRREKRKLMRWRKIALASMKQTGRSFLPEMAPITAFEDVVYKGEKTGRMIVFDPGKGHRHLEDFKVASDEKYYTLFFGPEAGFSSAEIEVAKEAGCEIYDLGARVFRSENAPAVALAVVMFLLGELR